MNVATQEELEKARLQQQNQAQQRQYAVPENTGANTRGYVENYAQGYTPSQNVQAAQSYLQGVIDKQPGQYKSSYADQIKGLYDQVMARPKFVYDVNKDPLFKSYKDQYIVNGQRAMQDTIGNAAALTGGYGNSWGTTAGYQAYQRYLQALNGVIPELEQRAFDRYGAEGDQMRDNISLALSLENNDYGRYRDQMDDWQADRAFAQGAYEDAADRDLDDYWKRQNHDWELSQYLDALEAAAQAGRGGNGPTEPPAADETPEAVAEEFHLPLPKNQKLLAQGIGQGVLLPETRRTYTREEADELARQMNEKYQSSFQKAAEDAARQSILKTAAPYQGVADAYNAALGSDANQKAWAQYLEEQNEKKKKQQQIADDMEKRFPGVGKFYAN